MSLSIKSFSQDVSLRTKNIQHYIVVEDDAGSEHRIPVQEDTVAALIRLSHADEIAPPKQAHREPIPEQEPDPEDDPVAAGAVEFGGEDSEAEDEEELQANDPEADDEAPESEEDVPSV